ncbi:AraC family transcriptional regulator [Diaphorobacter sp. LR2014-1]|nr:AraC family transcriptional regulator [Diaphorobacter sp. LR2014-1]
MALGIVLFPGFQLLDIAGPRDAFDEVAQQSNGLWRYDICTIGTTRGSINSSSGMSMLADRTIFDPSPCLDTLIVPGGAGVFDAIQDSTLLSWLRKQSRECRRIVSICNGAFALGAAGLLNEHSASTHWKDAAELARRFPRVKVNADRLFIKDRKIYTTAGVTAGIDLSLVLIEEDFGKALALEVARYLVVYLRRGGGQSQFSPLLCSQASTGSKVEVVQHHLLSHLDQAHTLKSIAQQVHMSERSLSRRFIQETGASPMAFLNNARIDAVRSWLEDSDLSIKEIAQRCGFDHIGALQRNFRNRLGLSPTAYRERFRSCDLACE